MLGLPYAQKQTLMLVKQPHGSTTYYVVYTEKCIKSILRMGSIVHMPFYLQKYRNSVQQYNLLLQRWMLWAAWNDIPLDGVDDLPNAAWYLRRSRVEKWVVSRLGLGSLT